MTKPKTRAFDTIFVGKSNRHIENRKPGNVLDRRLEQIEAALRLDFITRTNHKLNHEYFSKLPTVVNDIVREFLVFVVDRAEITKKSNFTGSEWSLVEETRWPSHDRHLLAAVFKASKPGVFVTETAQIKCANAVSKHLGISVHEIV